MNCAITQSTVYSLQYQMLMSSSQLLYAHSDFHASACTLPHQLPFCVASVSPWTCQKYFAQAAAFDVLQLEPPAPERPYIKGLLDPCTNSLAAPNVPAEVLYDKKVIYPQVSPFPSCFPYSGIRWPSSRGILKNPPASLFDILQ